MRISRWGCAAGLLTCCACVIAVAQQDQEPDAALLSVDRIYRKSDFGSQGYSGRWLKDGNSYTRLESSAEVSGGRDIVRYDATSGEKEVMVSASELIPAGTSTPLAINNYSWSSDYATLLVYTNSQRVWRLNTRGDYWVLDRAARQLKKLGGDGPPASLMFAKLSPQGDRVAYVREGRIYLEDLLDGSIRCLTPVDDKQVICGTSDWVYEEEFGLRDGFRWSADGKSIAYWQLDTSSVPMFPLVNNTDSLYPRVTWFAYPKVGQRNSTCRVGVVSCDTGETRWLQLPPEPQDYYVPRFHWVGERQQLLVQHLNRHQNSNHLLLADVTSGTCHPLLTEADDAWIDVHDELQWLPDGRRFTWISERDGWRHLYLGDLETGELKLVTPGEFDVVRFLQLNVEQNLVYFIASPGDATQRFLYRARLLSDTASEAAVQRVTPAEAAGTHDYQISSNGRWAIHRYSRSGISPRVDLVSLPDHQVVRQLEENRKLTEALDKLDRSPTEFFRVDIGDGVELDGWCIKPGGFSPEKKYPLLIYVYGEPAGSTVVDRWGGSGYLWHLMMAQKGFVVMSFDNRGTNAPRGRKWRKSVHRKIGILPPQDQAAAVRAVIKDRPYIDANRVAIWGWSGGGSSSLQAVFKYPDLYHAAIAIAPVPNQRYYDTIYQERYMGLPDTNVNGYRMGSPINFAKNLRGDLLLVHGTADDNCHYQTMEMLIDELIAHNKQFELMVYPNRTHAIRERKNTTRHLRSLMTRFLETKLLGGRPSTHNDDSEDTRTVTLRGGE